MCYRRKLLTLRVLLGDHCGVRLLLKFSTSSAVFDTHIEIWRGLYLRVRLNLREFLKLQLRIIYLFTFSAPNRPINVFPISGMASLEKHDRRTPQWLQEMWAFIWESEGEIPCPSHSSFPSRKPLSVEVL